MLDKKYIKYYIYGYLNAYYSDYIFSYCPSEGTFLQHRLMNVMNYLGIKIIKSDITWISPILSIIEAFFATLYVLIKTFVVSVKRLYIPQIHYENKFFIASLTLASFRMKRILESVRPIEVNTISIPFIKNSYKENEIDLLSCVSFRDIAHSLLASLFTIWTLYRKYRKKDPLFRSYSSFEYYLTCCFVHNTENKNRFGFYNNYDRWAFLMCNTKYSFYIQHGSLTEQLKLVKIGTPDVASFINEKQERIVKYVLLKGTPRIVKYRRSICFTENEILLQNNKKNVLLICWSQRIKREWEICALLHHDVNLYIKPHPGDSDNTDYRKMSEKFGCIIVPKSGYPKVDIVISYESTLADEYEDVGIRVIRYDSMLDLRQLKQIVCFSHDS